jgi:ABC-type maltose transport system permease subunit
MSGRMFMSTLMVNLAQIYSMAIRIEIGGWHANPRTEEQFVALIGNAGILLGILPIILMYFVLQRFFMKGRERSGIVG